MDSIKITEMTDKKPKWAGIPMSEEELKEYEKSFSDIEASIAYCIKHSCKVKKSKV